MFGVEFVNVCVVAGKKGSETLKCSGMMFTTAVYLQSLSLPRH